MLRILSLGAGVQSSTLALMMKHGEVEPVSAAIFADTGWEPKRVYEHLAWLETALPFPVYRVSNGNLRDCVISMTPRAASSKRYVSVPYYILNDNGTQGIGRRQCTSEHKITPLYRKARELAGLRKGQASKTPVVQMVIGISFDEAHRMKEPRERWCVNDYPLVDMRMRRDNCMHWLREHDYPVPPKSSCLGCPFHNDALWREIRDADADEWEDTCRIDEMMRNGGGMKDLRGLQFMHRSLRPLRDVVLQGEGQLELSLFGNECEGMCGV